ELSILGVARCAGMPDVLWESPEPAAVGFSYLFERNNPHLPPSVTELFLGEPVRRTAFFDESARRRSVHQDVCYEDFWVGAPACRFPLFFYFFFDRRWSSCIQSFE